MRPGAAGPQGPRVECMADGDGARSREQALLECRSAATGAGGRVRGGAGERYPGCRPGTLRGVRARKGGRVSFGAGGKWGGIGAGGPPRRAGPQDAVGLGRDSASSTGTPPSPSPSPPLPPRMPGGPPRHHYHHNSRDDPVNRRDVLATSPDGFDLLRYHPTPRCPRKRRQVSGHNGTHVIPHRSTVQRGPDAQGRLPGAGRGRAPSKSYSGLPRPYSHLPLRPRRPGPYNVARKSDPDTPFPWRAPAEGVTRRGGAPLGAPESHARDHLSVSIMVPRAASRPPRFLRPPHPAPPSPRAGSGGSTLSPSGGPSPRARSGDLAAPSRGSPRP